MVQVRMVQVQMVQVQSKKTARGEDGLSDNELSRPNPRRQGPGDAARQRVYRAR